MIRAPRGWTDLGEHQGTGRVLRSPAQRVFVVQPSPLASLDAVLDSLVRTMNASGDPVGPVSSRLVAGCNVTSRTLALGDQQRWFAVVDDEGHRVCIFAAGLGGDLDGEVADLIAQGVRSGAECPHAGWVD